jgi:hypothetical protein
MIDPQGPGACERKRDPLRSRDSPQTTRSRWLDVGPIGVVADEEFCKLLAVRKLIGHPAG